jgi:hypothetical protein
MIPAGRRLHRRRRQALFTLFTQTWSITDGH